MGNNCAKGEKKEVDSKDIKKRASDIKTPVSTMGQPAGAVQALKDPPQKPKLAYDRNKRLTRITEVSGETMSQQQVNRSTINTIEEDTELMASIHEPPAFNITPRAEPTPGSKPYSLIDTKIEKHLILVSD